jgi:hypothetical protein
MAFTQFSSEELKRARETSLFELLRSRGETLKRSGSEFEWLDNGQKVTIRGNLWYHQYEQVGGDAVDFVRRYYRMNFQDAVEFLLCGGSGEMKRSEPIRREEKHLELPPKNDNMRRVFAYLLIQRGIDRGVIDAFAHDRMIYEDAKYHNAVFVGYDTDGKPRHANKRGTGSESTYKGNASGSEPEYSFHRFGSDDTLYVFEAPIDLLSYISLHQENWRRHSYAACCGVADRVIFQCLRDMPSLKNVVLGFDSDGPGQAAARRISDALFVKGIHSEILVPEFKDWNEDLLHYAAKKEVQEECPVLRL